MSDRPGRGRRGVVVLAVVASLGLAACSSGGASDGGSVASLGGVTAGSSASAGAAPSLGGSASPSAVAVTVESLSDPAVGYVVESIPEGLDTAQTEVLEAYVAYSKTTWTIYGHPADTAGLDAVVIGDELAAITESYQEFANAGQHLEGTYAVAIRAIDVSPDSQSAAVNTCVDQTGASVIDGVGQDVTSESSQHRFPGVVSMTRSGGGWVTVSTDTLEADQC